jgi:hypothetical protein
MADIRISALPNEPAPSGSDFVAIDLASTRRTTVTLLTEAGRPAASQAEAEAGTNPTKAMTPLTTAQAIAALGATQYVPLARQVIAGAGLNGGGDLSADRTFDVDFTAVQPFSTKLTNFDGTSLSAGALIFGAGVDTFSVLPAGAPNQILQNIAGNPTWTNVAAGGDVTGPASSVDLTIPLFSGTTGKVLSAGNPTLLDLLHASALSMPTIQNNAGDATNDIDFLAGAAFSTDATRWPMRSTATITKQLDAAWAAGTGGGRMSVAAIANTTYHCHMIRNPTTGAVDFGFDTSATAPNLPAGYTQFARIASILRESGAIVAFTQIGDFFWRTAISNRSSSAAAGSSLLTLSIPLGIVTRPLFTMALSIPASAAATNSIGSAFSGSADISVQTAGVAPAGGTAVNNYFHGPVYSNTSAQIYFACAIAAGTITGNTFTTRGWIDSRGRN